MKQCQMLVVMFGVLELYFVKVIFKLCYSCTSEYPARIRECEQNFTKLF